MEGTAAAVLRRARAMAGLTQEAVGLRAGVAQSVISAYEGGHREPSMRMLAALVGATGNRLDVVVRAAPVVMASAGPVGRRLAQHPEEVVAAAARHGVTNLRVFGSVARGDDTDDSDLDLLVDVPGDMGLLGLGRLRVELEAIIEAPVDLVPASDLKDGLRAVVDAELLPL